MSGDHTQTEKDRQRHLEETARRVNGMPLRWEDKVEVWQEETSLSETTLAKILKQCGEFVPE